MRSVWQFLALTAVIGTVLGGTQALSRSLFSHLVPRDREAEYFAFYEVSDKGTSWLGPLVFAAALQWTDSYRDAIVSLVALFVAGFALLATADLPRGYVRPGTGYPGGFEVSMPRESASRSVRAVIVKCSRAIRPARSASPAMIASPISVCSRIARS